MSLRNLFYQGLLAAVAAGHVATAFADATTRPSSSQTPYLEAVAPGVRTFSILTVGDSVNFKPDGITPYRMVGIPDGLGAFDNGDGTFTLLMNHELNGAVGVPRTHGFAGAFISKWTIDKRTLTVLHGEDLMKNVQTSTGGVYYANGGPMSRFCAADLPLRPAFYDERTRLGFQGRIFMNGEESGTEGRAFAHFLDGNSYELPWLGKMSWENAVAHPNQGVKTVVAGLDDGTGGQVYVYVGTKNGSADPLTAAGLNNGSLFGIKINGFTAENPANGIPSGTTFTAVNFGDVSGKTGAQLEADSSASGVTSFQRPEDGCWDPNNRRDFYFVTTASFTGNSRLWRLRFDNPASPSSGGRIDMLLDGSEGPKMMDNITVSGGKVTMQEDPGNQVHLAKIWQYDIATDALTLIAQHDPNRFTPGAAGFLTRDEESSGIIPVDHILGPGWYLAVVQAHYSTDAELVEGGQLLAIHIR